MEMEEELKGRQKMGGGRQSQGRYMKIKHRPRFTERLRVSWGPGEKRQIVNEIGH